MTSLVTEALGHLNLRQNMECVQMYTSEMFLVINNIILRFDIEYWRSM